MRAFLLASCLVGASCNAMSADREVRFARTAIVYVYELDDGELPVGPIVLGGGQAKDVAAIGDALVDAVGVPEEALHLRAASFWVSFRYDTTLDSAPLRLCLLEAGGESEVVVDRHLPPGGATILVPYEEPDYRLVMAVRVDNTDPDQLIELQERLRREVDAHTKEDPRFPPALVHRIQECPDAQGAP